MAQLMSQMLVLDDGHELAALAQLAVLVALALALLAGAAVVMATTPTLPRAQLVHFLNPHHPGHHAARRPAADEAVEPGAEADAHDVGLLGAVDDVEDGRVQVAQGAAAQPADAAGGDGGRRLRHEVARVGVARGLGPVQRLGRVQARARRREAREVEGAQLDVRDGDGQRAQLARQHLGEGREGRAHRGFGRVEGRVDGGDDGRGEDEHFRGGCLFSVGRYSGREEGEERLDGEYGMQEMRVEKIGKARRGDRSYG